MTGFNAIVMLTAASDRLVGSGSVILSRTNLLFHTALKALVAENENNRTHMRTQFQDGFEQTRAAMAIIGRNNYTLEFANDFYLQIIDKL